MWSLDETKRKIDRVRSLPYGSARTAAAEHVARTVEKEGPAPALPLAYLAQVEAYVFGQPTPASFAVFSKLLRLWDTHPEYFDEGTTGILFWQFKWIVGDLTAYPQISQAQARELLDEMRKRYRLAGLGESAPDRAEYMWAAHLGRDDEAEEWRAAWLAHGEDEMDCSSCRHGGILRDYVADQEYERAIEMGAPTEDLCNREPAASHRQLARAYLHLGDGEAAGRHLLRAQATRKDYDPDDLGLEFEILARGGLLVEAFQLLVDHGKRALALSGDPGDNRNFLHYLVAGLAWAVPRHGDMPTGLRPAENGRPRATLRELYDWALAEARPLAQAFDRRAENTRFTENLREAAEAPALAQLLLPTLGRGSAPGSRPHPAQSVLTRGEIETDGQTGAAGFTPGESAGPRDRAEALLAAGDHAGAFETLRAAGAAPGLLVETLRLWCLVAEKTGGLADLLGPAATAVERAERALAPERQSQGAEPGRTDLLVFLLARELQARLMAVTSPAGQGAADTVSGVVEAYSESGFARRAATLRLFEGELASERGQATPAIEAFLAARQMFADAGLQDSAASALEAAVELLQATGQAARAEALVAESL
ncbi:hypothetical protein [Rothia nasisuis]|uniref:hypothetical protein n=1 Tax=Rothia nasisuis TaxID=2109647 RepID=UPI001F2F3F63|nr:hypothetical protein [Rothia nasisuis]